MPRFDGLGGEGVTQAVGVHVVDAGDRSDAGDDSVHGATVDRVVVVGEEPAAGADVLVVGGGPVGEEVDDFGVQGDHAVVAELADRHTQPVAVGADPGDGVSGELAELGGAQPGAGQDLGDEAVAGQWMAAGGGHEGGGLLVSKELGERFGSGRDVAVQDRVPAGRVGPVPLDEPLEEDPDHPQPLPLGVLRQRRRLRAGLGSEPHLEVLEVSALDLGDRPDIAVRDQPAGELTQRGIGGIDAARREERGQLEQVAAHRDGKVRRLGGELGPFTVRTRTRGPGLEVLGGGDSGHRFISCIERSSAAASASIRSVARRYSAASQSSERCR
jgi:hypothetical protein